MGAERKIEVTLPNRFEECSSCPFAERAVVQTKIFAEDIGELEYVAIDCKPAGVSLLEPAVGLEGEGRTMISTSFTTEGRDEMRGASNIPACPQVGSENLGEKYPHFPHFEWYVKGR